MGTIILVAITFFLLGSASGQHSQTPRDKPRKKESQQKGKHEKDIPDASKYL